MLKKLVLAFAFVAVLAAAFVAWPWLRDNRLAGFERPCELYVRPGMSAEEVMDSVISSAGSKWPRGLVRTFRKQDVASRLKPGHYCFPASSCNVYVARMLNHGWQTPVRLTLSGTMRRKADIAVKISRQMMVDSATVHSALDDRALLASFGFTPENVFSMIFPDTYEMYWTASVAEILSRQKKAYDAFWTEDRKAKAAALKLTPEQVSVVASIVKGESNYVPEFPLIAGVYLNRLRKGMKLQADPTIAFCYDYKVNRILRFMLSYDSPYNTYKYAGLPPGPIYVPTRETLDAVLNPDFGNGNLYFCADPSFNGSHRFARSYGEHLRNARAFQKALNLRLATRPD